MKAFAYLRVSGLGQVNGDGFPRQEEAIRGYARKHRIQVVRVFQEHQHTDDCMRFSFRLAELVNYQPDPKKRPGVIKSICELGGTFAVARPTGGSAMPVANPPENMPRISPIPPQALRRLCEILRIEWRQLQRLLKRRLCFAHPTGIL